MVRAENAEKEENAKADTFVNHGSLCMITTTSANFIRSQMENAKREAGTSNYSTHVVDRRSPFICCPRFHFCAINTPRI